MLLVHGLGRTPASMWRLARYLEKRGHGVETFGYFAVAESFARISARLRTRLEQFANPGPYAVVGHSLGGLLLRDALRGLAPAPLHFVMLATPNRSPRMARKVRALWPYRLATGQPGQLLAQPAFFAGLAEPRVPYTIIAGTAGPRGRWSPFGDDLNDWLVAVDETRIRDSDQPILLRAEHTFMMGNADVQAAVARALQGSRAPSRQ